MKHSALISAFFSAIIVIIGKKILFVAAMSSIYPITDGHPIVVFVLTSSFRPLKLLVLLVTVYGNGISWSRLCCFFCFASVTRNSNASLNDISPSSCSLVALSTVWAAPPPPAADAAAWSPLDDFWLVLTFVP
jgi:hypothetical protein